MVRLLFFTLSEMGAPECSGQDWAMIRVIYRIPWLLPGGRLEGNKNGGR